MALPSPRARPVDSGKAGGQSQSGCRPCPCEEGRVYSGASTLAILQVAPVLEQSKAPQVTHEDNTEG